MIVKYWTSPAVKIISEAALMYAGADLPQAFSEIYTRMTSLFAVATIAKSGKG